MLKFSVDDRLFEQSLETLQKLINIPSLKDKGTVGAPFGKPIAQALDYFLNVANDLGFQTRNLDGYVGIVEMGEGDEELGVLVHLDVVPIGDESEWRFPPFSGEIADGAIWGRGTLDDKGPAVAVLYAMKILKDMALKWNKRVRLIIGTDEESTWKDIDYYKTKEEPPTIAFTPDGCFPVTHSEKGMLTLTYEKEIGNSTIVSSVHAGDRLNMTPGKATAIVTADAEAVAKYVENNEHIHVEPVEDGCQITITSREGNSASPIQENNAIHILLKFLQKYLQAYDRFHEVINFYDQYLQSTDGKGHHLNIRDEVSGPLTLATVRFNFVGGRADFFSNVRYPSTFTKPNIIKMCSAILDESSFKWGVFDFKEAIYIPESDPFIQQLLAIYNNYFNKNERAQSISGGTYARAFPNTVAFGALIPGKPLNAHEVNEHVEIEVIRHWINIYAQAIYTLAAKKED